MPFVEKYRPKTLSDVIGQPEVVRDLSANLRTFPHVLFVGPPGTGKTSCAEALCADTFGAAWRSNVLFMDASVDRGIDIVRGRISDFASTKPIGAEFQVVVLDEVDSMTHDAQMALRGVIVANQAHTRFVLTANHFNRLHPAVIDRCKVYHFRPVPNDEAVGLLLRVCGEEGITFEGEEITALEEIYDASKHSIRHSLAALQLLSDDKVTVENIRSMLGDYGPTLSACKEMLTGLLEGKIREAEQTIIKWIMDGGTADQIFLGLFEAIVSHESLSEQTKNSAIWRLADYEFHVYEGCNLELQVRCFLREFASRVGGK